MACEHYKYDYASVWSVCAFYCVTIVNGTLRAMLPDSIEMKR